jgi:hypothetical protein
MSDQAIVPVAQTNVFVAGYSITAVLLPDGQSGAVLNTLCAMLDLKPRTQAHIIRNNPAISNALVLVALSTPGGIQATNVILAWAIASWAAGLEKGRRSPAYQELVFTIQREAGRTIADQFTQEFRPSEVASPPPAPSQSSAAPTVWQEWHILGDHLEAEFEGQRRQALEEQQALRERLTAVEDEQHHQALRLSVLEAGEIHSTRGSFAERLLHIYLYARQLRARRGMRITETLAALTEHFRVEDISDLSEKDWPAVRDWFTSLLEEW